MSTIVILGAGIIGTSTAYYLSKRQPGSTIHLVEASPELFASSSGFAAGFLAKDWFAPELGELGALSFEEHRKLAEREGGAQKWGYSRSTSISLSLATSSDKANKGVRSGGSRAEAATGDRVDGAAPRWLPQENGQVVEIISEDGTTAQVDPYALCQFLLQECLASGVHLHQPAQAISIRTDMRNEVASIRIADTQSGTETDIPCTNIIITAGCWSPQVFETLFPQSSMRLPVSSLAGHALLVKSPRWTKEDETQGCHAVFVTARSGYSPEIFSRNGGQIFVGGLNSATERLPELATDAKGRISKSAIEVLRNTAREILGTGGTVDDLEVVRESLCFRPVTNTGLPVLGRISDEYLGEGVTTRPGPDGGVYVATGHGPWGISQALGTGMVMAEMVQGRTLSADVSKLALKI